MTHPAAPRSAASAVIEKAPTLLRLAGATALLWPLSIAASAPELPLSLKVIAGVIVLVTLRYPPAGLVGVVLVAPAGLLLAPAPAGASEAIAWSFLAGWLAGVWRPLRSRPTEWSLGIPIACYTLWVAVSWTGLVLASSSGVAVGQLPGFLLRAIALDHLVFSNPDPESWSALHALTGMALLAAGLTLARGERRLAGWVVAALVASAGTLGVVTLTGIWHEWVAQGYGGGYLWRYITGVRYSLHLTDLNAAGSYYVLAALAAAALAVSGVQRVLAVIAGVVMIPALWLTGSRSAAFAAMVAGVAMLVWGPGRTRVARAKPAALLVAAGVIAVVLGASVVTSNLNSDPTGSVSASLGMRSEFTATSVRMFAAAPVFGVGIGRYYQRSPEFMSANLRTVYAHENAHNYFLQQFAELGLVGGVLFLMMLTTLITGTWRALAQNMDAPTGALLTGCVAYLVTCLTGHPLLVPEVAFPFWIALGTAAAARECVRPCFRTAWPARGLLVLMATSLVMASASAGSDFPSPPDQGFHDERRTESGTKYRWSTRHATMWIQPDVGFLTMDVQAPDLPARRRPFIVQLEADGRVVQRALVPPGRWTQVGVALRSPGANPRRRIDLRINQVWTEKRDRPGPNVTDERPMGVRVGYPTLHPLAAVGERPDEPH